MNTTIVAASSVSFIAAAAFVGQLAADFRFASQSVPAIESLSAAPTGGADIITGDLNGVSNHGAVGPTAAYSLGTTKCNVGGIPLAVEFTSNQHHLGVGNIMRVKTVDGATRIEQVGQSWVFNSFCDLQQSLCGPCTPPPGGGCADSLGVGCSSPNTAARMGSQANLGPRYDVNAATGFFSSPQPAQSVTGLGALGKRIQVASDDLNPALNPGASYFGEALTVHPQDAADGNQADNASYRSLLVGGLIGTPPNQHYPLSMTGGVVSELPALYAWQTMDPTVQINAIDIPADGRFYVGFDATDLGDGAWHYEYAIYNISSHRSGQSFSVPIPDGVAVTNIAFKDVDYHTQDILEPEFRIDNVDWTATVAEGALTWFTSEFTGTSPAGNENTANALRWGTMYNFRFDADAPPATVSATLALFRPGTPDSVSIQLLGPVAVPACPADLSGDGQVNGFDLAMLLAGWGPCLPACVCCCPADLNCSGATDGFDLATLLAAWGDC